MTTPLSPAAQAVLNEVLYQMCAGESESYAANIAAAIVRAAADQVVPDEPDYMRAAIPSTDWWDKHDSIRSELLAIAKELDPTP
jgi:hypothetical protein